MSRLEINQLDLFSGIGGFHLGFERAGYKVNSYFSEVDKHAVAVYKNQFKDSTYVGSVTDVRGEDLPRIDLITFGSPCQDFSLAGKRKGMEGERSSLITEAIRLVHECRPRVFIWENVKGTFSSNNGADFWAIIQAFTNIGGYRLEWQLLNTSWFLPQNRERIYLVGYSTTPGGDWRGVFPIGEEYGGLDEGTRKAADVRALVAGAKSGGRHSTMTLLKVKSATSKEAVVEPKYNYKKVNETIEQNPNEFKEGEARMMDLHNRKVQDISPCLVEPHHNASAVYDGRPKIIGYTRDAKGKVTDRHLKDEAGTIHSSSGGGGNTDQFVQEQPMIAAQRGRYQEDGTIKQELEINKEGKSNTLTAVQKDNMAVEPNYRIRRLTPIECERLQGFPDNHTEYGNYDGEVKKMSNTQRYKQCGNAVTVDVVQAVAEQLKPIYNA
jgi:DNA (cytosine-5)-methyltransferase 1